MTIYDPNNALPPDRRPPGTSPLLPDPAPTPPPSPVRPPPLVPAEGSWRSWPYRVPPEVVLACVFSSVGAFFAGCAPTGVGWWDPILTALIGGIVPLLGSSARRTAWLVFAGVATAFSATSLWLLMAAVAFVVAFAMVFGQRRSQIVGAWLVVFALQAMLRWPQHAFFGVESVVAAMMMVLVVASGYQNSRRTVRRRFRKVGFAVGAFAVTVTLLVAFVALRARGPAQAGVTSAELGLAAARSGDVEATLSNLTAAEDSFRRADGVVNAPYALPARLIPIVSQHLQILGGAARNGSTLARAASQTVQQADLENVSLQNGAIDIAVLTQMAPSLADLADELVTARADLVQSDSQWVLPMIRRRVTSLTEELDRAIPEAQVAADASEIVPGLLGVGSPRRYFVIFGSPSESREFGGFIGSWALIEANQGQLAKIASGRATDLYDLARAGSLDDPAGYPELYTYANPGMWPQNLTATPSIDLLTRATKDLFPDLYDRPIDGIVYLDPFVMASLLELTGPISVDGLDFTLTSENTVDFLNKDQYRVFPDLNERYGFLAQTLDATFVALASSALPGPERLGAVFGPHARAGRLQIATGVESEDEFLASVFLRQAFEAPPEGEDFLAVVTSNGTQNKLDTYLHRSVTYRASIDSSTGEVAAEVHIELRLDAPDDVPEYALGPPEFRGDLGPGDHLVFTSVYTPHDATKFQVDGEPVGNTAVDEFGLRRYMVPVQLSLDDPSTTTVVIGLSGSVNVDDEYRLTIANQPLVNTDTTIVELSDVSSGEVQFSEVVLDQDQRLRWQLGGE